MAHKSTKTSKKIITFAFNHQKQCVSGSKTRLHADELLIQLQRLSMPGQRQAPLTLNTPLINLMLLFVALGKTPYQQICSF